MGRIPVPRTQERRTPEQMRAGRRLFWWCFVVYLVAAAFGLYRLSEVHLQPRFDVVYAGYAVVMRAFNQLTLRANDLMGRRVSWKHLRWPWILRTAVVWSAGIFMAGYAYYTWHVYKALLSWIPARGVDHLRSGLHVEWLALTIGVVLWAVWLTIALEVIRLIWLHVFGVSVDQDVQSAGLPGFLKVRVVRGEGSYLIALTLWFFTFDFSLNG